MFFSTALLYAKCNPRRSEPCSKKTRGPLLSIGNPGCLIWDPFNGSLCSPYNWTVKSPINPKQPIFSILKGSLLLSHAESVHAIVLGPLATIFSSFYLRWNFNKKVTAVFWNRNCSKSFSFLGKNYSSHKPLPFCRRNLKGILFAQPHILPHASFCAFSATVW